MNDTHQQLRDLITRIVTGDGQQRENLELTDEEHRAELSPGGEMVDITIDTEDWLEMVEVARNNTDTYPPAEDGNGPEHGTD